MNVPTTAAAPLEPSAQPTPRLKTAQARLLVAASLGSAIEQYDFFCYAFIAPIAFGQTFFPKMDALAGTLAVYTTFAIGLPRGRWAASCSGTTGIGSVARWS